MTGTREQAPAVAGDPPALRPSLRSVADSLLLLPYQAWRFGDSVAFEGMVAASEALSDERWLRFAQGFVRGWAARPQPYTRLDCTAPGLAMLEIHRRTDDPAVLEAALGLATYLVSRPRVGGVFATWERSPLQHPYGPEELSEAEIDLLTNPPAGVFVDCLHFDPPFLVTLGAVTGQRAWTDEGAQQALGYVRLLRTESGLFDHFVLEGSPRTYGPGWGRGQGWALLGLLDVLDELPADHPSRQELADASVDLITAMIELQRDDGHWNAVVDDPGSGDETSTAAFMAAGMYRAARLSLVGDEARRAADRALDAALAATDGQGVLTGVSAAVNASTNSSHYSHVPRGFVVPWGQGPLALALVERLGDDNLEMG
jgi:unsaturated rhamnogalacturonyl hydrolase